MECVANMVSPKGVVCDVGCDHGFVSIYLMQRQIATKVLAMDVVEGPLQRAIEHIEEYQMQDVIETRLSDGLEKVTQKDNVSSVVIAGMGGILIAKIMQDALERGLIIREFILQPQSGWDKLRSFLRQESYRIEQEDMILEDGKFYPVIRVVYEGFSENKQEFTKDEETDRVEDLYGPLLLEQKHPILQEYLVRQRNKFQEIKQEIYQKGQVNEAVEKQLETLNKALAYFE